MPHQDKLRELDVYKTLVYKLCDFLLQKRYSPEGRGIRKPLSFPVSELGTLFEYVHDADSNQEKIEKIKQALVDMSAEPVGEDERHTVIRILTPAVLEQLQEHFTPQHFIRIMCTSEDLYNYQQELKRRTEAMRMALGEVTVVPTTQSGAIVHAGEKEMKVRAQDIRHPVGPRLLLLISGNGVPSSGTNVSIRSFSSDNGVQGHEDYVRGNVVGIDFLQQILTFMEYGEAWRDEPLFKKRSIRDSLRNINKDARKKAHFEADIFRVEGDSVWWIL